MLIDNLKNKKLQESSAKNKISSNEKHFPSPVREWNNSVYVYNKNTLNSIPYAETSAMKIIKSYFSIYNKNLGKITRTKKLLNRFRKYSTNKIYVSKGGFKHTNNKVLINLYIYNRQKHNYIMLMKNWYKNCLKRNLNSNFINRLKFINKEGLISLKKANENKNFILKALINIDNNKSYLSKYGSLSNYINNFYKIVLNKTIKKIKTYYYYKQLLYTNKCILNYSFLQYLQKYLEYLYNKNVEFNIINLKKFFFNSDILSESITLKITRNRRKLLRYLNS